MLRTGQYAQAGSRKKNQRGYDFLIRDECTFLRNNTSVQNNIEATKKKKHETLKF